MIFLTITVHQKKFSFYRNFSSSLDLENEIILYNTDEIQQNLTVFISQIDAVYSLEKKRVKVKSFYSLSIKFKIIHGIKLSSGDLFCSDGVGENGKEEFLKSPRVILILGQSKWV